MTSSKSSLERGSPLLLTEIDDDLKPIHACELANFNASAAAPELPLVQRLSQELIEGYQRAVPGSLGAREYLLRLRSDCDVLLRTLVLREVQGEFVLGLFPGTSRAMEAALWQSGPATEIILSPYEHQVEMEVARWLARSGTAKVRRIRFRTSDYEEPWPRQRARVINGLRRLASIALERGRCPTVVLSQVFWATGAVIPVQEIAAALREDLEDRVRIVIDGAHASGNTASTDLGPHYDAFVLSAHKWLLSPEPCGILVWPGKKPENLPYDAWLFQPPPTTCGIRMIAGLRSGLEVFRRTGFAPLWQRSEELKALFLELLPEGLEVVGRNSGLAPTCMLAVRPAPGWSWVRGGAQELRAYFYTRSVSVTAMQMDLDTLWVRIALSYFLEEREVDHLCKVLGGAVFPVHP